MLRTIALSLINAYQSCLRPVMPATCRFVPSCSDYAKQAIQKYGVLRGTFQAAKRILSCHPFSHKSGYDPVR